MINLLLSSADTFHEVKKKRDRKKEVEFLFHLMGEKKNLGLIVTLFGQNSCYLLSKDYI